MNLLAMIWAVAVEVEAEVEAEAVTTAEVTAFKPAQKPVTEFAMMVTRTIVVTGYVIMNVK
jgi:hypothetical protein